MKSVVLKPEPSLNNEQYEGSIKKAMKEATDDIGSRDFINNPTTSIAATNEFVIKSQLHMHYDPNFDVNGENVLPFDHPLRKEAQTRSMEMDAQKVKKHMDQLTDGQQIRIPFVIVLCKDENGIEREVTIRNHLFRAAKRTKKEKTGCEKLKTPAWVIDATSLNHEDLKKFLSRLGRKVNKIDQDEPDKEEIKKVLAGFAAKEIEYDKNITDDKLRETLKEERPGLPEKEYTEAIKSARNGYAKRIQWEEDDNKPHEEAYIYFHPDEVPPDFDKKNFEHQKDELYKKMALQTKNGHKQQIVLSSHKIREDYTNLHPTSGMHRPVIHLSIYCKSSNCPQEHQKLISRQREIVSETSNFNNHAWHRHGGHCIVKSITFVPMLDVEENVPTKYMWQESEETNLGEFEEMKRLEEK